MDAPDLEEGDDKMERSPRLFGTIGGGFAHKWRIQHEFIFIQRPAIALSDLELFPGFYVKT